MALSLKRQGRRTLLALAAFLIVGCGTLEHDRAQMLEPQRTDAGRPLEASEAAPVAEPVPVPDTAAQPTCCATSNPSPSARPGRA